MNTYLLRKHDMLNSWLAKYDYDTCRSMPLYSHRKKQTIFNDMIIPV